jgi:hypothetical protein
MAAAHSIQLYTAGCNALEVGIRYNCRTGELAETVQAMVDVLEKGGAE